MRKIISKATFPVRFLINKSYYKEIDCKSIFRKVKIEKIFKEK